MKINSAELIKDIVRLLAETKRVIDKRDTAYFRQTTDDLDYKIHQLEQIINQLEK